MSFVLDALKVSERRRSRFSRPVYAHPPRPHRGRRRRRWIAVPAAIAVLSGVFAAWRLLIPTSAITAVGQTGEVGATAGPAAREGHGPPATSAIGSQQKTEADAPAGTGEGRDVIGLASNEQAVAGDPVAAAGDDPDLALPPENPAVENTQDKVPPDWPPLTLQMLYHSPQSDRSFVQINGRSYREGERLEDGPDVVAIARDGVILAHQGETVRLAMQR